MFRAAWQSCRLFTNFPLIDTSKGTNFAFTWSGCTNLTSFPLINTSNGTDFTWTWRETKLVNFPQLNLNKGTIFNRAWETISTLTTFPANMFDTCLATDFTNAWNGCALTAPSIENILVSINTANTSNGTLHVGGGTNAQKSTWTTAANTAYDALIARGWTITFRA